MAVGTPRRQAYDDRMSKKRVTVTLDEDVAQAVRGFVERGTAPSVSAILNDAARAHLDHFKRLEALDKAIAAHEAEFGEITDADMEAAERWIAERTIWPNGRPASHETPRKAA